MRKGQSCQQMVLEKLGVHMQRMKLGPFLIPQTKINSKWIKDLNIRPETIKLLEKNWTKLHNIGFGNDFLDMTPKARVTKERQIRLHKNFFNFVHQETLSTELKDNLQNRRKYLQIYI